MTVQPGQLLTNLIGNGLIPVDNGGPQVCSVPYHGGTFTANGTSAVTVANANLTAKSIVLFSLFDVNAGTPAGAPYLATVTAGTGFTVKAAAGDTGKYNYVIIG